VLCAISGLGGAELSLLELVAHLRDSYEFHLIVPGEGPLKESAELAGAKVWVLPWPEAIAGAGETAQRPSPARMLRSATCLRSFARRLSELLDEIGPSVFVTNAAKAHVIGSLARKRKHVPLIWYMRTGRPRAFAQIAGFAVAALRSGSLHFPVRGSAVPGIRVNVSAGKCCLQHCRFEPLSPWHRASRRFGQEAG